MEIDITDFVTNAEPFEFSRSIAECGEGAGSTSWANAKQEGARAPLLTTEEHFDALRAWAEDTGAWDAEECAAWDASRMNALFIQIISGDMREAGIDDCDLEDFDWDTYQADAEKGRIGGNIYRGDIEGHPGFGRIFYYLGS